jgi:hypothetical protein
VTAAVVDRVVVVSKATTMVLVTGIVAINVMFVVVVAAMALMGWVYLWW